MRFIRHKNVIDICKFEDDDMKIYEIQERTPQLLASLLDIWEKSVRATHLYMKLTLRAVE